AWPWRTFDGNLDVPGHPGSQGVSPGIKVVHRVRQPSWRRETEAGTRHRLSLTKATLWSPISPRGRGPARAIRFATQGQRATTGEPIRSAAGFPGEAEMPISVMCECGKKLSVKDDLLGKRIKCPVCGAKILVAEEEPDAEPVEEE